MAESSGGLVAKVLDMPRMVSEDVKISTNMEVLEVGLRKDLESLAPELVESLLEVEVQALMKTEDALENEIVSVASAKKFSQQWSVGDANVPQEIALKKNYPRRRVSVTRDYPPFCGRNAPCPTEEEHQRVVLRNTSFGGTERAGAKGRSLRETGGAARASALESERNVRDGNAQKNELRGTVPEPRNNSRAGIKKVSVDVRDLLGKVPKEIMVHSHGRSPKRMLSGGHVGLGCGVDRVIGQGLMASPNCLWKQGKGASKTSRVGGMSRSKLKKQDFTGQGNSRTVVRKNNYYADY
ncbi:uncharacterized protein LOC132284213 [Cornus florida]|uniref:uncharacterized protein LOC132284213 n=1 Tax=Cornus florida TaxID=4283 RepID=UPI00289B4539|nr:uncharacterized protein LOC132284213 [Cornus florida]